VKYNPYEFANEIGLKIENIFCTPCHIHIYIYICLRTREIIMKKNTD
jgi:hypothetical protein